MRPPEATLRPCKAVSETSMGDRRRCRAPPEVGEAHSRVCKAPNAGKLALPAPYGPSARPPLRRGAALDKLGLNWLGVN